MNLYGHKYDANMMPVKEDPATYLYVALLLLCQDSAIKSSRNWISILVLLCMSAWFSQIQSHSYVYVDHAM